MSDASGRHESTWSATRSLLAFFDSIFNQDHHVIRRHNLLWLFFITRAPRQLLLSLSLCCVLPHKQQTAFASKLMMIFCASRRKMAEWSSQYETVSLAFSSTSSNYSFIKVSCWFFHLISYVIRTRKLLSGLALSPWLHNEVSSAAAASAISEKNNWKIERKWNVVTATFHFAAVADSSGEATSSWHIATFRREDDDDEESIKKKRSNRTFFFFLSCWNSICSHFMFD